MFEGACIRNPTDDPLDCVCLSCGVNLHANGRSFSWLVSISGFKDTIFTRWSGTSVVIPRTYSVLVHNLGLREGGRRERTRGWMAGEGIADRASQPIMDEGWRNKAGELTSSGPGLHSWLAQTLFFPFLSTFSILLEMDVPSDSTLVYKDGDILIYLFNNCIDMYLLR